MDLASNIVNTLKHIGQSNFPIDSYNYFIENVFNSFNMDKKQDLKIKSEHLDKTRCSLADSKEITLSLYGLIAELAKYDYDSTSTNMYLEEVGFTEEKIKYFTKLYNEKKSLIRQFLLSISYTHSHIVDVKWRFDYSLKENNLERLNEVQYIVELILENPNKDERTMLQFSCTVEKLQDLVYKLKEASKSLEKFAQTKEQMKD